MPVMDYRLLYESMLTQKQEMDAQHELLGDEVKRLKSVIARLKENATAQALALKAAKAMQQAETERADKAEADCKHWKANHENQVLRARILMERPDMPIERVKAYKRMQELEALSDELFNTLNFERGSRVDMERDAARYRWLLQQAWFQNACDRYDLEDGGLQNKFEELLGATIDQAMSKP